MCKHLTAASSPEGGLHRTRTFRQAPRIIQGSGLEWLFRLMVEPRWLWKRYLRINPEFVLRIPE